MNPEADTKTQFRLHKSDTDDLHKGNYQNAFAISINDEFTVDSSSFAVTVLTKL